MNRMTALAIVAIAVVLLPLRAEGQFRYPPMSPGHPGYWYNMPESNVRLLVKPAEAAVYVDGYFAGEVDDFDGTFQRLHVAPGEHEIVVHLNGYRSLSQKLYLSPNTTRKIEATLEKLPPGEAQEPPPVPSATQVGDDSRRGEYPPFARDPRAGRRPSPRQPPTPALPPAPDAPRSSTEPAAASRSGVLSIRVQPAGTTVFIDGERWSGPSEGERLIVQVREGRRRIDVEREGYERFTTDIDVLATQTVPVNINLTRQR